MPPLTQAPPDDRLPGLHALRLIAAGAIFILHAVFWSARWVEPVLNFVSLYFALGVQLFYVVSAFALMHSTRLYEDQPAWVAKFYLKRFFRIAPLYYIMIGLTLLHFWWIGQPQRSAVEITANVFFVNNLWPDFVFGIPFAGWSVGVEVLFYLIFPLLFVLIRTVRAALILTLSAVIIGEVARRLLDPIPLSMGVYGEFSFPANFRFFAFGILAFMIYDRLRSTRIGSQQPGWLIAIPYHLFFAALSAGLVAAILAWQDSLRPIYRIDMMIWGVLFMVVTVWFTVRRMSWLGWSPIQWLGERSYSLYLLHVLVIYYTKPATLWIFEALRPTLGDWALAPALLATWLVVVLASAITYALIERPSMALARLISRQLKRPSPSAALQGSVP